MKFFAILQEEYGNSNYLFLKTILLFQNYSFCHLLFQKLFRDNVRMPIYIDLNVA